MFSMDIEEFIERGRQGDEENEDFRLRCWFHAAKTIKASRYLPTKRKGYAL